MSRDFAGRRAATIPREYRKPLLYHLANRQANRGHEKAAQLTYKRAHELPHAARGEVAERIELSSRLRWAQVERSVKAGNEALNHAADVLETKAYSYLTALLLRGWNAVVEERRDAQEFFDRVLGNVSSASWLYIAEAIFGKTCCILLWGSCDKDRVYQLLVQAQYIYVMLGLQGTPHTRLPARLGIPSDCSCFPGHILTSGRFADLSSERRMFLRQAAIGVEGEADWLYLALQETLCGREGSRARIELLRHAV